MSAEIDFSEWPTDVVPTGWDARCPRCPFSPLMMVEAGLMRCVAHDDLDGLVPGCGLEVRLQER